MKKTTHTSIRKNKASDGPIANSWRLPGSPPLSDTDSTDIPIGNEDRIPTLASYDGDASEADTEDDVHLGLPGEDATNDYDYETEQDSGVKGH